MNRVLIVFALLVVSFGCSCSPQKPTASEKPRFRRQLDTGSVISPVPIIKDKQDAVGSAEKAMAEADRKVNELAARVTVDPRPAAAEKQSSLTDLYAQRDLAERKLDELKASDRNEWQSAESEFYDARRKLGETYDRIAH